MRYRNNLAFYQGPVASTDLYPINQLLKRYNV